MSHFAVPSVTPAHDMIGDLLQRLDLHGDVTSDFASSAAAAPWQPFHDFGAIGRTVTSPRPA